jgi:hypothetical protein
MNLFSGLNNPTDITTRPEYAAICGYTHHNIQTQFKEHLSTVDLDKLKQWYNGYDYLGGEENRVYNPYDILLFIDNHFEYKNYWWSTGNPGFLIKKLKEQYYYIPDLENIITTEEILDTFDVDCINLVALLWHRSKQKNIIRNIWQKPGASNRISTLRVSAFPVNSATLPNLTGRKWQIKNTR